MQKITVPTAFNIELEFETADFLHRFLAWLIDLIIIVAYLIISSRLLDAYSSGHRRQFNNEPFLYNLSSLQLILFVPVLLYHLVCELLMNGQTPGKKLFQLRVISENGGRPALHQFLLRWLIRLIDFMFIIPICAAVSYFATRRNQRLGDLAAGTMVIKSKMESSLHQTVFFEVADTYQPKYANVLTLSDRDMNIIKKALDKHRQSNDSYGLVNRIADTIRTALQINEYGDDVIFLETILKDYNHLSNK